MKVRPFKILIQNLKLIAQLVHRQLGDVRVVAYARILQEQKF